MTSKLRAVQEEARELIRDSIVEDAISRFIAQILEVAAKDRADRVAAAFARAERAEVLMKEAVTVVTAMRGNLAKITPMSIKDKNRISDSIEMADATLARIQGEGDSHDG